MQYTQTGQSRGVADIIFSKPDSAANAAKELNGMLVDKRPMKARTTINSSKLQSNSYIRSKWWSPLAMFQRKTIEELDAEMTDYFGGNSTAAAEANGTAAPAGTTATGEDLGMDEISVSSFDIIT